MGTQITFRRGSSFPTAGSGITLAEPVFETTLHTFHIGLGHGVTAEWVGAPISGLSADIGAGITYKIPTAASVLNYISGLCFGITNGVRADTANTFTALQSFGSGISASGITVNGNMSVTGNFTVSGGVTFTTSETVLIEDNIITLNSNVTGSPSENAGIEIERGTSANVQLLWNESSDRWTFTNDGSTYYDLPTSVVTSFNGNTGAVQGVSSVNGSTGAITNVARTNVNNNFTEYQIIKPSEGLGVPVLILCDLSGYTMSFTPNTSFGTPNISVDSGSASQILQFSATASTNTVTLPNFTTTLAGLTGTQTFTGLKTFTGGLCASAGITFNGTVSGATATFSRLTTHTAGLCAAGVTVSGDIRFSGTSAKTISSNQATLTIAGVSTSPILVGSNSVVMGVQVTDSLTLNSATSVVDISTTTSGVYPSIPSIRILTDDGDMIGAGSIKIIPASYATANRTQYLQDASGTLALTSQLMGAVNGSTAATTAVTSFNGSTGAVQGVSSFNGLTGAVGGVCAAQANTFTALQSFNSGISSAGGTFTQETRFASGLSASVVKTLNLSGYGGLSPSFIDGQFRLSQFMGTFTTVQSSGSTDRSITLPDADGTLALTSQLMGTVNGSTAATTAVTSFNGRTGAVQGVSSAAAGTGISVSAATGAITITNIGVQSFNGSTGAVQGVSSVNGSTGAVTTYAGTTGQIQFRYGSGITANQNISLASPGSGDLYDQFLFYGVTYNSGGNRVVYGNVEAKGLRIDRLYGELALDEGGAVAIQALGIYNDGFGSTYGSDLYLTTPSTTNTNTSRIFIAPQGSISLEIFDTGVYTAVPLSVGATFTAQAGATFGGTITGATATFSRLTTHSGGISAAGGTFSALTRFTGGITTSSLFVSDGVTFGATAEFSRSILLQNSEFIRNSTNGRIDFMPAPSGTTHYGLYVDCTTWGYGPQIGTIRSSDNALDTVGILFTGQITMGSNVRLNLGSNGQNGIVTASQGNDTIQIFTDVTSGTNSGAVAIIDTAGQNTANRSPTTVHANPNLYIYRAGSASANDFIRIEHDGTNANIVTGGSSAIDMEPGSGFVGFSGGISASGGITFSSTMRVAGTATFAGLINSTAGLSGTGITLSGNLSAATKSFVIPHPTQPHMTLQHGSLEGPENGVYVRGRLTGTDTIPIPHYWSGLVDSSTITVTLTEIGNRNHHWVAAVDGYTVTVASEGGGIDCFYTVWGERKDVGKLPVEY